MGAKEKLERQLNDNPELKKQFDVWGAGIRESISKKKGILESDYTKIAEQYETYLRKEAKILPINFEEFFSWIAKCRYPDEPFGALKIQENDFKLFHEFKERKYNTTDWNENKEWLFLNNQSQGSNPDSKGSKHKKQGRPKAVIQDASHYLSNEKLLPFLKSKYSEIKPQVFNHLIRVLIDLNQLKPATKKEYKEAFGKALNVKQSQTNFDNSFILNPNTTIYTPIKIEISNFLGSIEI